MTAEGWKCLESSPCFQRFERSEAVERLERLEQILGTPARSPKRLDEGLIVALAEKNLLPVIATRQLEPASAEATAHRLPSSIAESRAWYSS
jgi:hypothetical protein